MKVLITGAGGFVGTALVKNLIAHGYSVRGLIRKPEQAGALEALGAEVVIGDLSDPESLKAAVSGVKRIYHIAALFRQAGLPDSEFYKVNVDGTRNIIEAGLEANIEKFIHCSTVGVHGNIENPPGTETTPFAPGDPYQKSKLEGELLVAEYFKSGKLSGSIIRPAMIYGPNDTRTLKLFKAVAEKKFFYVGPGNALVHFIDVRDLAEAFRLAGDCIEANGETFIIAGKTSLPLRELVSIIATLFGVSEPKIHLPVKPMQTIGSICEAICTPLKLNPPIFRRRVDFFTKNRNFDSSKAEKILNFHPSKSLVEELIDIIDSYIDSQAISNSRIEQPAYILRTLDGEIQSCNKETENLYGISEQKLTGKSSHEVFKTVFPDKLENINKKLNASGKWSGVLFHQTSNKQAVAIDSKWLIVPNTQNSNQTKPSKLILEVNKAKKDSSRAHAGLVYLCHPELLELVSAI